MLGGRPAGLAALIGVEVFLRGLRDMTQQNAALVEQTAAAAESLKQQAAMLNQLVAVFKIARF